MALYKAFGSESSYFPAPHMETVTICLYSDSWACVEWSVYKTINHNHKFICLLVYYDQGVREMMEQFTKPLFCDGPI